MNRSSKGFGLTGVAIAVAAMIVMAVFSTSARSHENSAASPILISVQSACAIE